jgi:hypothetical protein
MRVGIEQTHRLGNSPWSSSGARVFMMPDCARTLSVSSAVARP